MPQSHRHVKLWSSKSRARQWVGLGYCIRHIFRGSFFREFCESGAICEFNNTRKLIYLRSRRKTATSVYAILVVQYAVHVQMSEWYWFLRPPSMIALLLDLTTRGNVLKSRFAKYMAYTVSYGSYGTYMAFTGATWQLWDLRGKIFWNFLKFLFYLPGNAT